MDTRKPVSSTSSVSNRQREFPGTRLPGIASMIIVSYAGRSSPEHEHSSRRDRRRRCDQPFRPSASARAVSNPLNDGLVSPNAAVVCVPSGFTPAVSIKTMATTTTSHACYMTGATTRLSSQRRTARMTVSRHRNDLDRSSGWMLYGLSRLVAAEVAT